MADFKTALARRRSNYRIDSSSAIPDGEIRNIVEYAVVNTPSAFNSQSARVVLLFGEQHGKFWEIVGEALRKLVPADNFKATGDKIASFAAGHGTVLFYEDQEVIRGLQASFPLYADAFPGFSQNSAGMVQHVVWVMLRDAGLGATLQHYGNLVQEEVAKQWNLPAGWLLVAQMPFGGIVEEASVPERQPIDLRVKCFA